MRRKMSLAVLGIISLSNGALAAECGMMELYPLLSQFDASCSQEVGATRWFILPIPKQHPC